MRSKRSTPIRFRHHAAASVALAAIAASTAGSTKASAMLVTSTYSNQIIVTTDEQRIGPVGRAPEVGPSIAACWHAPHPGDQVTVQLSFKRDGSIFGRPMVKYLKTTDDSSAPLLAASIVKARSRRACRFPSHAVWRPTSRDRFSSFVSSRRNGAARTIARVKSFAQKPQDVRASDRTQKSATFASDALSHIAQHDTSSPSRARAACRGGPRRRARRTRSARHISLAGMPPRRRRRMAGSSGPSFSANLAPDDLPFGEDRRLVETGDQDHRPALGCRRIRVVGGRKRRPASPGIARKREAGKTGLRVEPGEGAAPSPKGPRHSKTERPVTIRT